MSESPRIDQHRWDEAARWLVFVDEDLRAVEILMADRLPVVLGAAFHCQQAVEKMAKAVLVAMGCEVPKIHDVEELSWLVRDLDMEIGDAIGELGNLTSWATVVRYPDVEFDVAPSADDVRIALVRLHNLRHRIAALAPPAP